MKNTKEKGKNTKMCVKNKCWHYWLPEFYTSAMWPAGTGTPLNYTGRNDDITSFLLPSKAACRSTVQHFYVYSTISCVITFIDMATLKGLAANIFVVLLHQLRFPAHR